MVPVRYVLRVAGETDIGSSCFSIVYKIVALVILAVLLYWVLKVYTSFPPAQPSGIPRITFPGIRWTEVFLRIG